MKILFVVKQKKNVDTFLPTIRVLLDRGHSVGLAVQEWSESRDDAYRADVSSPQFSVVRCPTQRADQWADVASLLRSLRDCAHYQQPALKDAAKLQARSIHKLREELRLPVDDHAAAAVLRRVPPQHMRRLESIFELAERQLPSDPLHEQFLRDQAPDLLLLSPLVHFGSAQADLVTSARALGIPVSMLLYSWDNLSTKGCLHRVPDRMFVWNDEQRREAQALHGYPQDRVVVVGAPRFDAFFELSSRMSRADFHEPLGLDPARPTMLYVCSSQLVSAAELGFVRKWIDAIRASNGPHLRECNVVVRPHPDIPLLDPSIPVEDVRWPAVRGAKGFASRPFDDARAVVLRTSDRAQQGFFECIYHSAGVVGLNTTAELEAAIVGRRVYTIVAGSDDADGQSSTLHFHYLLEERGGCVRVAHDLSEHTAQLETGLSSPPDDEAIRAFAGRFLRPNGVTRPVAPLLADAIERALHDDRHRSPEAVPSEPATAGPAASIETAPEPSEQSSVVAVSMAKHGYTLQIQVSGDPGGDARPRLDKNTIDWIRERVGIGDVLYDVDAGLGVYSVLAARYHGAVVVSFEPGFTAFKDLCDNVRVNGCDGSVLPLPVALADWDGLGELKFPSGMAGQSKHTLKPAQWRVRRAGGDEGTVRQMVCAMTLDEAMRRYGLPAPNHLRCGGSASVVRIIAGASQVLERESLKTIFLTVPVGDAEALIAHPAMRKWTIAQNTPISRGRAHVQLCRAPVTASQGSEQR
jgi:FkbM family methyltransferase